MTDDQSILAEGESKTVSKLITDLTDQQRRDLVYATDQELTELEVGGGVVADIVAAGSAADQITTPQYSGPSDKVRRAEAWRQPGGWHQD